MLEAPAICSNWLLLLQTPVFRDNRNFKTHVQTVAEATMSSSFAQFLYRSGVLDTTVI